MDERDVRVAPRLDRELRRVSLGARGDDEPVLLGDLRREERGKVGLGFVPETRARARRARGGFGLSLSGGGTCSFALSASRCSNSARIAAGMRGFVTRTAMISMPGAYALQSRLSA